MVLKARTQKSFCKNWRTVTSVVLEFPDKLQPLDVSVNKSMKNKVGNQYQMYYADEVRNQLSTSVAVDQIKIDLTLSAIKTKSASWIISSRDEIEKHPEIVINSFRKAGIIDILNNV